MAAQTLETELKRLVSTCQRLRSNRALRKLLGQTGGSADEFFVNLAAVDSAAQRALRSKNARNHVVFQNAASDEFSFDNVGRCYHSSGVEIPLRGKPLRVLKAIVARGGAISHDDVTDVLWPRNASNDAYPSCDEEAVRGHIFKVRRALRSALRISGDPLPTINRGDELAWELRIEKFRNNGEKTLRSRK